MEKPPLVNCKDFASRMQNNKRWFYDKKKPIGDIADPFEVERICHEINSRISTMKYKDNNLLVNGKIFEQSTYPDQRGTSLCGPAAFWYCVLKDNPSLYKKAALDLWENGKTKVGRLKIKPGKFNRHPKNIYNQRSISGLDWMMLGGLRDSENPFFLPYDGGKAGGILEGGAGLTLPHILKSWFKQAGSKIEDLGNTYAVYGLDLHHPNLDLIKKFNQYAGNPDYHVVTLIGSGMLAGQDAPPSKDHWIVWESPVRLENSNLKEIDENSYDEIVQLKAFSWGDVKNNALRSELTLKDFIGYIFGGFVAGKIP